MDINKKSARGVVPNVAAVGQEWNSKIKYSNKPFYACLYVFIIGTVQEHRWRYDTAHTLLLPAGSEKKMPNWLINNSHFVSLNKIKTIYEHTVTTVPTK